MLCFKVNPEDGRCSINKFRFSFDESSEYFLIDNETVKISVPIGLQLFNNYMYIYLNPQTIISVSANYFNQLMQILKTYRIPCLKVPQKQTQIIAEEEQSLSNDIFVQCGSFDYQHNCYLVVKFGKNPIITIKDQNKNILYQQKLLNQGGVCSILFHDLQKMITLGFNSFYFWKQLEYFNFKFRVIQNYPVNKQAPQINQMVEQQYQKDSNKQYEPTDKKQRRYQLRQSTIKKRKENQQNTTARKKTDRMEQEQQESEEQAQNQQQQQQQEQMNQDDSNIKSRLRYSTINNFKSYNVKSRREHSQRKSQMIQQSNIQRQSVQGRTKRRKQKLHQFNTQVCCLFQSNVLDIKQKNNQNFLFYHNFQSPNSLQASPTQLHNLRYVDDQEYVIKPTKLIFDNQTNSAFYNDQNRQFVHSFNLEKNKQQTFYMDYPVLDMVRHKTNCFLGIHQNIIFQFDTRTKAKAQIQKYRSVHNLSKISAVFGENYYVTAGRDGCVRTYDIRNNIKALNKFQMDAGITSLQLSDSATYILCRYGDRAEILSCVDKNDNSVFESRVFKTDRRQPKNLVKGYQNLSHIQLLNGSDAEGDVMAIDKMNPCNLVIKNIELSTSFKSFNLNFAGDQIQYLNCFRKWVIFGKKGKYFRQKAPWIIRK